MQDRIEIHIEVPRVVHEKLSAERVAEIRQFCRLDDQSQSLMRSAMAQMQLSARAYHRILKHARTIADLAASQTIQPEHLAEALHLRQTEIDAGIREIVYE